MTIKYLAYRFAHEFAGGAVALASLMGRGEKVLQNKLNPNSESHHLTIDEFSMLADFTNRNFDAATFFAEKINAVVVCMPDVVEGDMALLDAYMQIVTEMGKLASEFQKAYADGTIDAQEYKRICKAIDAQSGKLQAFKASVKRVVR